MRYSARLLMEDGDPIEVVVDGRDIRKWESKEEASYLQSTLSVSILTELGFFAAKRTGKTELNWAEFSAACVGVEAADEAGDGAARPTRKARGGGKPRP